MADKIEPKCTKEGYIIANKLVRDKVPEQIKARGGDCEVQELSLPEFQREIRRKLLEEMQELLEAESKAQILEEATDVYFALLAFMKANRVFNGFEKEIKANFLKKGGYEKQLYLICYSPDEQKTS